MEEKIEGIPECFQDIIYSDFFPGSLYNSLEIQAIHWHELRIQQRCKGKERKTGGPAYRHFREIVGYMLEFNEALKNDHHIFGEAFGRENIFEELKEQMELEEGVPVKSDLIQLPIITYFAAISHDDLEDDEEISGLVEEYKRETEEKERLWKHKESFHKRIRKLGRKQERKKAEKAYRKKRKSLRKLKSMLDEKRELYFDQRSRDFRNFLKRVERGRTREIKQQKRMILNQFRICERILNSLTRHVEEESYINSMPYFFARIPGNSDKDVLIKSFTKLCDRLINVKDIKQEYDDDERESHHRLFCNEERLRDKFGDVQFQQKEAALGEVIYNAGKSIIVLNSLHRWVLNSDIPKRVLRRGYPSEKYYLYLVMLAENELIKETINVLEEKRIDLETNWPQYFTLDYLAKADGKTREFRRNGGYDRITTQKKKKRKMFGHGTLELITNKAEIRSYLEELHDEKRKKFLYLVARNCLEVMYDFRSREKREYGRKERYNNPKKWHYHVIKGLTDRIRPLLEVK